MQKRVGFKPGVLPYALVAPQIAITLVFFIWPAGQALFDSLLIQDAFGLSTQFVWLENFERLVADPNYLHAFRVTAVFSAATAGLALGAALLLAVMADRVIKAAVGYKTVLIAPYAVAPVIAGVLWLFLFNPTVGIIAYLLRGMGYDWNHFLNGGQAMFMVIVAAAWKQVSYNFLFFLAGLQAIPR
ncbi:MAG: glycerol-3-phosphate transporter permease, partial [Candidatus Rokuibacteriota bacterium]